MSNKVWSYTVVKHPARIALGLSVLEYAVLDIIYKSQTSPRYSTDGWATVSTRTLAAFLGMSSSGVGKIYTRMEDAGYLEFAVDRGQKRTTADFYDLAYLDDLEGVHKVDSGPETGEKVSTKWTAGVHKVDRTVHKVDRNRPQSGHIKKDKEIKKEGEKRARGTSSKKNGVNSRDAETSSPHSAAPPSSIDQVAVVEAMVEFYEHDPEGQRQWHMMSLAVGAQDMYIEKTEVCLAWVSKMLQKAQEATVRNWRRHTLGLQNYIATQAKQIIRNESATHKNGAAQYEHGASKATIVGAASGVLARRKKYR